MSIRDWFVELLRDWADRLEEQVPTPPVVGFMPELWEIDEAYRELVRKDHPLWHAEAEATLKVRA